MNLVPSLGDHWASGRDGSQTERAPQDAGFSIMDSKRIAPVRLSRRMKRKG
jgi:hypothetical protein